MWRTIKLALFLISLLVLNSSAGAETKKEYLVFSQSTAAQETTIYLAALDDLQVYPIVVVAGSQIEVYQVAGHLLYFSHKRLYEFDVKQKKATPFPRFKGEKILIQTLPGQRDQALLIAEDSYSYYWYIIDFQDHSIRRITNHYQNAGGGRIIVNQKQGRSPDGRYQRLLRPVFLTGYYQLAIRVHVAGRWNLQWTSPPELAVLAAGSFWAPDSQKVAFYACDRRRYQSYYSLYIYDLQEEQLQLVHEAVFAKASFQKATGAESAPSWSTDSRFLVYQTQPYGAPIASKLVKFDLLKKEKKILTESPGANCFPQWVEKNKKIIFRSNRRKAKYQLYLMEASGEGLTRISPAKGQIDWFWTAFF